MDKVEKPDAEWRAMLSPLAYEVTRRHGTERAGSHEGFPTVPGKYHCICCDAPLFDQDAKFESYCGWPSFTAPASKQEVGYTQDTRHGMRRTEVHCTRCDAHLGHVFPDGPPPTGMRYCINGVALRFVPDDDAG